MGCDGLRSRALYRPRRKGPVKHERSAGGLVLKREGATYEALLIGRSMPRIWSLPKGHVEPNESVEAAATREVLEETGIQAAIISKLSDIRYWFYANKIKHSKVVHFFLMRYMGGSPVPQLGEVDEAVWAGLSVLPSMLTHINERRLIEIAQQTVNEKAPHELGFH
ncbi:MAG: NUDIX hydrolase [Candidatus Eremiobacteraeota bacterium]|nr:NUDIX hydrolase [Candidatus Eremiobacteraeota bacterium]MBC5807175.1 NUDIX hydrolase [Candidatus Eremiobacteraeota bacterium]